MHIGRKFLTFLVAASVTMLPLAAMAAPAVKTMDMPISAVAPVSNDVPIVQDISDCCSHDMAPCDNANAGCTSMAACASTALNLFGLDFSSIVFPIDLADAKPVLVSQILTSQTGSPPFRPPRV